MQVLHPLVFSFLSWHPTGLVGVFLLCCFFFFRSSFPVLSFLNSNPNPTEYGAEACWARRCPEVGAGERAFLFLTGCDLFLWVWLSSSLGLHTLSSGGVLHSGSFWVTLPSGVPYANCTFRFGCLSTPHLRTYPGRG